ncbi:MAG: hypothetical protein EB090_03045 [Verrucomicrobia bacterium]|nr:hypothetical protein [Verrucomicrobiota bacterium]
MKINDLFNFQAPLKNDSCASKLGNVRRLAFISFVLSTGFFPLHAAPDFKIRYNQKFPCLEVMDSKAVKITDVTEGAKGETVTSGKSSINISFVKNPEGQPEVTLSEAKSPLSEMEVEAFGLSVGLKPAGTVLVRFGPDNKPRFEMDRTGGARFLMADLGNLDTASGKDLATLPAPVAAPQNSPAGTANSPSKALTRCRERFAAWKEGKGGWSNKSGKILKTLGEETLQIGKDQPRALLEGEAVQVGGTIVAGSKGPMIFQSAAGVFHQALPGTEIVLSPLEKDSLDIKLELKRGTLLTFVATPLVAPRANLVVISDGIVARTGDGLYQITKGADGKSVISVTAGKVTLADVAGGVERGSASANEKLVFPGGKTTALAAGTPEGASLKAFPDACREATLMDIAQDGVLGCPESLQEIFTEVISARPDLKELLAAQAVAIRPECLAEIQRITGLSNLDAGKTGPFHSNQFIKRAAGWLRGEPSPLSKDGKVLKVVGGATCQGQQIRRGQILPEGAEIKTGPLSQVMFLPAPGVIAEVQENSEVHFISGTEQFEKGVLTGAKANLKTVSGDVHFAIADGYGDKIQLEISTSKGVLKAQSTMPGSTSKNQQAAAQ